MGSVETVVITVKKDDTLWDIVGAAGFPQKDLLKIYNADFNRNFRKECVDPNFIKPGQKFVLPKHSPKEIEKLAEQMKKSKETFALADKQLKLLEGAVNDEIRNLKNKAKKKQEVGADKLKKITTRLEQIQFLTDHAMDQCWDMYACAGAGQHIADLQVETAELQREYAKIALKLIADSENADKILKAFQARLENFRKTRDKAAANIKKLEEKWMSANQKPY